MTVNQLIRIIRGLRSDEPCIDPSKWYTTQKEHWLGRLDEYHSPVFVRGPRLGQSPRAGVAAIQYTDDRFLYSGGP